MATEKKEEKKSFDELWAEVKTNTGDFNAWTSLLTYIEHNVLLIGIDSTREVFNSFFEHYPYCYGYWKKLADLERKNVQEGEDVALEKCRLTFERGLEAIPLSVDLWIQYINFMKTRVADSDGAVDILREIFKKSIDTCGMEFRSDRLWDLWIQWETEQQNLTNVTAIYDKLISTPTQLYTQHFEKFQGILEKYPLHETLSSEELVNLKNLYGEKKEESAVDGDEETFIRSEAIQQRKEVFRKNEEACTVRWTFEEGIKRPYFHVKALEKTQIKNWKDYLDMEIEMGDEKRIRLLFERCLIACALYEDMWMKYINWSESIGDSLSALMALFKRSCEVHLPKKATINLAWLAFVEVKENAGSLPPGSIETLLRSMEERFSGCIAFAIRRLHILRRMGRREEMEEVFKSLIRNSDSPKFANVFAIKYARFLAESKSEKNNAIQILKEAVNREPDNSRVQLTMIEIALKTEDEDLIAEVFRNVLKNPDISQPKKLEVLQRKVEYYEEMTSSVEKSQQALEEYTKMLKLVEKEKDRKRPCEENGSGGPDGKKRMEEYQQMGYYDRNGQTPYGTQTAAAAAAYGQHAWSQSGYAQAGYGATQTWNGQQAQQAYTGSYQY